MEDGAIQIHGYIPLNTYCDTDVDYISWILLMNKKENTYVEWVMVQNMSITFFITKFQNWCIEYSKLAQKQMHIVKKYHIFTANLPII